MKMPLCFFIFAALLIISSTAYSAVPEEFPRYKVPGFQRDMDTLRRMYWMHYSGSGPKSTLWDAWLAPPSLWPDMKPAPGSVSFQSQWSASLAARIIDEEGYVASHQHPSISHQLGWPFPFWNQGTGGYGWHFSFKNMVGPPWRQIELTSTDGLSFQNAQSSRLEDDGLLIECSQKNAVLTFNERNLNALECPFVQIRWRIEDGIITNPSLQWRLKGQDSFSEEQTVALKSIPVAPGIEMAPVYKRPLWKGRIIQLRLNFGNDLPGKIWLQGLFTHPDTRHNINNTAYINGCYQYISWTGDTDFLKSNIDKMRLALEYAISEFEVEKYKAVWTNWTGHDGRSGLEWKDGKKIIQYGLGVGNNYWDLLPFGGYDMYATMYLYNALIQMAEIEDFASGLADLQIKPAPATTSPKKLLQLAGAIKKEGNRRFFVPQTGRFASAEDVTGKLWDYGLTFVNLESIYYDFADKKKAQSIISWINGDRIVAGDTSTGQDIYHWQFGPRATTRRNIEYYSYPWSAPESIAWGGQVQDGGAVFGFTFHDLMARLNELGPDNAWKRLQEICIWYRAVEHSGGYRKYYDGSRDGSLQGGGTAGGLGLDQEFFESVLATQVMIEGFMGFKAFPDHISLSPSLPTDWPELTITNIRYQSGSYTITATNSIIKIKCKQASDKPLKLKLRGRWQHKGNMSDSFVVQPEENMTLEFEKVK